MSSPAGHRRRPRPLVPGKVAEIRPAEYAELLAARRDLDDAKRRLRRVTTRLQLALGDAELGVINGQPVLLRQQSKTGGRYVRVNNRDDIRAVGGPAALQGGAPWPL